MLSKPYSATLTGDNFRLVEENKNGKNFYYLVGKFHITVEYILNKDNLSDNELKIPLTVGAYESLKSELDAIKGSRIDVFSNLELKFIAPTSK